MKKLYFFLLAVMLLTACGQTKENDREAAYMNITAEALVELGYTNIREFGGIIDWPYEVER